MDTDDSKWLNRISTACVVIGFLAIFIFMIYSIANKVNNNKEENNVCPCSCSYCIERENDNG